MLRTLSLRPPPPTGPATQETQSLGPRPVSVPALCSSSRPSIPQFSSLQIPQIPPLALNPTPLSPKCHSPSGPHLDPDPKTPLCSLPGTR